jgi:hypothetical protein
MHEQFRSLREKLLLCAFDKKSQEEKPANRAIWNYVGQALIGILRVPKNNIDIDTVMT